MDLEFSQHHADNKHCFVLIKIQWSCLGYKNIERSDQFLMSRFSLILTHGIDMQIPFEPMLEWSYAEARTATLMSYDTRIQNFLQKTLKKPIV